MQQENFALWKCLLTGGLAGFVNGFFGAGGGMIVVPLLVLLVGLEDKKAFSSAISIILPLSIVSLVIYAKDGALDVKTGLFGDLRFVVIDEVHSLMRGDRGGQLAGQCVPGRGRAGVRRAVRLRHRRRLSSHGLADGGAFDGTAHGAGREPFIFSPRGGVFADFSREEQADRMEGRHPRGDRRMPERNSGRGFVRNGADGASAEAFWWVSGSRGNQ